MSKELVTIHDYVDCGLAMLHRMFNKREKKLQDDSCAILFSGETASADETMQLKGVLI